MHILLTRPLEDCSEMIIRFKSLGHEVSQALHPIEENFKLKKSDQI